MLGGWDELERAFPVNTYNQVVFTCCDPELPIGSVGWACDVETRPMPSDTKWKDSPMGRRLNIMYRSRTSYRQYTPLVLCSGYFAEDGAFIICKSSSRQ